MKEIICIIKEYYHGVNKPILILCTLFTAVLIWLNYQYHLEYELISRIRLPLSGFFGHFFIYMVAFAFPHLLLFLIRKKNSSINPGFWVCLIAGPVIFAVKVSMDTNVNVSANSQWNSYWNDIVYWPMRMIVMVAILIICRKLFYKDNALFGLSAKKINYSPYLIMLLIMVPLIAAASTQPDFLAVYPKMKTVLPLPDEGKPQNFSGAVGNFTFKAEMKKDKLKTNDATNLSISIAGRGNIKLIEPLKINIHGTNVG